MRWNTVLLDLDGTVTDPKEGITGAAAYALHRLGREVEPDSLTALIGPPLHESFPELCGLNEEETKQAIREFRVYYSSRGWAENVPYAGMSKLLAQLRAAGLRLIIATSKPEAFARRILMRFELDGYFDLICGSRPEEKASADKASVVHEALKRAGETGRTVMVGDRRFDIIGAHKNDLPAIGVLYGYGCRDELESAGADALAADPEELRRLLLREEKEDSMDTISVSVARQLLSIGAVFLRPQEPFVWASGIKSPIYCDNRLILTAPTERICVEQAIAATVKREFPQAEVLMGTATAGIAHAAIAAHLMGLPLGYVRSGSKDHGRKNQIEGRLEKGQKVVVVEDLISTGGSVLETVEALREAGAVVLGVVSIFTYGMKKGVERLAAANVKTVSLTDLDTIARVGVEENYITQADAARLMAFRDDPSDESWIKKGGTN